MIEACRMLIDNRIHRLPVIDPETGDLFAILNQKPLLKFLFNIPKVRTLTGLSESIEEAGVGSYDNISVSLSLLSSFVPEPLVPKPPRPNRNPVQPGSKVPLLVHQQLLKVDSKSRGQHPGWTNSKQDGPKAGLPCKKDMMK